LDLALTIADIKAAAARSLRAIAAELNRRGIRTLRRVGEWQVGSVAQLLAWLQRAATEARVPEHIRARERCNFEPAHLKPVKKDIP
jgi:hypothetical protein